MDKKSEKVEHRQVCDYIRIQYPNAIFNTDASGIKLTIGQAVQMKKLRSNRAFPDIVVYEPRNGYYGLFIEMKKTGEILFKKNGEPKTEHIKEQLKMCEMLMSRRYYAMICIGFEHAKKIIDWYMNNRNKR